MTEVHGINVNICKTWCGINMFKLEPKNWSISKHKVTCVHCLGVIAENSFNKKYEKGKIRIVNMDNKKR